MKSLNSVIYASRAAAEFHEHEIPELLKEARLANAAVRELAAGKTDFMVGWTGPGVTSPAVEHDPYVVATPLDLVLAETARLHAGDSPLAQWRKRIYREVEQILVK